jgi:uncharacterized membrane protein (DUF4010 family)
MLDCLGAYGLFGGGGALIGLILLFLKTAVFRFLQTRSWQELLILTSVISLVVAGIVNPYWEGSQPLYVILVAGLYNYNIPIIKPVRQLPYYVSFSSPIL